MMRAIGLISIALATMALTATDVRGALKAALSTELPYG
jgi:hypothetical protein